MIQTGSKEQLVDDETTPYISDRLLTIPNIICWVRLIGSFVLIPIAFTQTGDVFFWVFLVLAMSDWVDGKLAIILNQRSVFGARLDSWADAALYTALLIGLFILHSDTLLSELEWIVPPLVAYIISTAAGFWKYSRWPSYHTRAAKICWFLIILGAAGLLLEWSLWPLRIAMVAGALTNIEAICITLISPRWQTDVTSIYHAWRDNKNN